MNCFNLVLALTLSLFDSKMDHFVSFEKGAVRVEKELNRTIITLPFEIMEGFHIQSNNVLDTDLIPTEITFESQESFQVISYQFSSPQYQNVNYGGKDLSVLYKGFEIRVYIKSLTDQTLPTSLKGKLTYQTCDERKCYFPRELAFEISI